MSCKEEFELNFSEGTNGKELSLLSLLLLHHFSPQNLQYTRSRRRRSESDHEDKFSSFFVGGKIIKIYVQFSSCVPNFLYWCARIVYGFVTAFWLCYISFQMWFMSFISRSLSTLNLWAFFSHLKSNLFTWKFNFLENVATLSVQIAIII